MSIYLYSIIVLLILTTLTYFIKYKKLKTAINKYKEIGTGRKGFYMYGSRGSYYHAILYVDEIDRYTDGYSKIKLNEIEFMPSSSSGNSAVTTIKNNFITLKKTDEIDWLESEDSIKKARKEKLENIKKI